MLPRKLLELEEGVAFSRLTDPHTELLNRPEPVNPNAIDCSSSSSGIHTALTVAVGAAGSSATDDIWAAGAGDVGEVERWLGQGSGPAQQAG
jgi:hypothetical protein